MKCFNYTVRQTLVMNRAQKVELGEGLILLGFLFFLAGLAGGYVSMDSQVALYGVGGGFVIFLVGAELYLRYRQEPHQV